MTNIKSKLNCIVFVLILSIGPVFAAEKMLLENEKNSISIFQNAASSIVNVSNMKIGRGLFNIDATEFEAGMGSGFIWDKSGHIVTNFHVVENGESFLIRSFLKPIPTFSSPHELTF